MTPEQQAVFISKIAAMRQELEIYRKRDDLTACESRLLDALSIIESQQQQIAEMKDIHCKDCCCARSWDALGISAYTGKSIPEHITALREQIAALQRCVVEVVDVIRAEDSIVREALERNATTISSARAAVEGGDVP